MALLGEGPDMPTRFPPQSLRVDVNVADPRYGKPRKGGKSKRAASSKRSARARSRGKR